MLVVGQANRRYLSGFTGTSAALLVSPQDRRLVTDARYTEQAGRQAPAYDVIENVDLRGALADWAQERAVQRIGVESEHTSIKQHRDLLDRLADAPSPPDVVPLDAVVEQQRVVKDEAELALLREAVRMADDVMARAADALTDGLRERTLANDLERFMRELGGDEPSFPTIVAAGPNAAMAHHTPSERPMQTGEPVIVDLGVRLDGYCSDITRSFSVGPPDDRFREVYSIVLAAQTAAEAGTRAGMTGREADALARQVIAEAGFADRFGHGTGHGVGLEIHEAPTLSPRAADALPAGAVTSVEPGVYLPGWGGVRIEDLVVIGAAGVQVLTQAPK